MSLVSIETKIESLKMQLDQIIDELHSAKQRGNAVCAQEESIEVYFDKPILGDRSPIRLIWNGVITSPGLKIMIPSIGAHENRYDCYGINWYTVELPGVDALIEISIAATKLANRIADEQTKAKQRD